MSVMVSVGTSMLGSTEHSSIRVENLMVTQQQHQQQYIQ